MPQQALTDEKWISVLTSQLADALDAVVPRTGKEIWNGHPDDTTEIPPRLLDGLIEYLKEGDFVDDHSVGICMCGMKEALSNLQLARDGLRYCVKCGGVGSVDGWAKDEYGEPIEVVCPVCIGAKNIPIDQPTIGIEPGTSP